MSARPLFAAALVAGLALPATADAAPQVLGLVASNGQATPLVCSGSECTGHFSSFCLQELRDAPPAGYPYRPYGGAVTLVLTTAGGETLRLPGDEHLQFASRIGFTSVKITLPRATMERLGAAAAAVEVGPMVSLLPAERANDPDPQSEPEIALATGPMREIAARSFEATGGTADAARVANILINGLPERDADEPALRDGLWQRQVTDTVRASVSPEGLAAAERIYRGCQISVESKSMYSMRDCLELRHADLMATANQRFWQEGGGS